MHQTVSLEGAVDVHGHCGPSLIQRRVDGHEFAAEAGRAGMDAVVLKEHYLPTVYGIPFVERLLARDGIDVEAFGSLVMNYCNGGFNPFAVRTAIEYGAKVVWAPTIDARNHAEAYGGLGGYAAYVGSGDDDAVGPEYEGRTGLYALDGDGDLKPGVEQCIDVVVESDVALFVGHLSYPETEAMVRYATARGHERVVIDHPNYFITDFDLAQQRALVDLGATLNFPAGAVSPKFHWLSVDDLYENLRAVGVDNALVSSDLGQVGNPSSPDGIRMLGELLLEAGLSTAEFRTLVETNPKAVLGI